MTARRRRTLESVVVRVIGLHSVEFAGAQRAVAAACTRVGARYMRSRTGKAWLVRRGDAHDVMAALEADGHPIEVPL